MKKILVMLCSLLIVVGLCACENKSIETNTSEQKSGIIDAEDATTTNITENDEDIDKEDNATSILESSTTSATSASSTSKPQDTSKPTTSTTTPSTTKPTECKHNIKYTFDNIANTWSHTGQCTLCKEYFSKNTACADPNKDNKCDTCSEKMDFGTAYKNVGYVINWMGLDFSEYRYNETPILTAETVFMETRYKTKESDVKYDDFSETYIYSASEFEKVAKSLFNINDATIAEMKTLKQERYETLANVYDSATNTYSYEQGAFGGGASPQYLGYRKISDTEYAVYINDTSYDYVKVINCTYTNTVKISSIFAVNSAPADITRFE